MGAIIVSFHSASNEERRGRLVCARGRAYRRRKGCLEENLEAEGTVGLGAMADDACEAFETKQMYWQREIHGGRGLFGP